MTTKKNNDSLSLNKSCKNYRAISSNENKTQRYAMVKVKDKAIPVQALRVPEG
jgi:hypothetical protein